MSGSWNYRIFTQWNSMQQKERRNSYSSWQHGWDGEPYGKWNKPGGKRQIPYDLTYKWNLINKTKEQNRTRDREIKNKLTVHRGVGGGGEQGIEGEGSSRNMYKGPMDKANSGGEDWRWVVRVSKTGENNGVKTGTTVIKKMIKMDIYF